MSNQDLDKKLELLGKVLEFYDTEYSEGVIDLIMTSLKNYSAKELENAAPILMKNHKTFSIKDWTDIVHECGFYEPKTNTSDEKLTDEEWEVLMNQEDEFYNRMYPNEEN